MSTLSLCMIVKNEEANLGDCLKSIAPVVDEMIIVDTGSTDKTVEIALSYGAKVLHTTWENDFAKARNLSIKDATSQWILWLDADDRTPSSSLITIEALKQKTADCVYAFTVRNERPNGTGTEFLQARMFPNHKGLTFERPVHEQIMLSALKQGLKMVPSQVVVEHHGYADAEEMKKKAQRNIDILEANLEIYGVDPVTYVELGDSYSITGDSDMALSWYEKTVAIPNVETTFSDVASQAWMGMGNIANSTENYDEAVRCFEKVIELCPGRIDLFYNFAVTYEKQKDYRKAVETLQRIYNTPPSAVKVGVDVRQAKIRGAMKMIRLILTMDDEKLLLEKVDYFLNLFEERQEIWNCAGIAYYRVGKLMEGLKAFEQSLSLIVDGNVDSYIGLALIYLAAERSDQSVKLLEQGEQLFGYSCRYRLFLSLFFEDREDDLSDFDEDVIASEKQYLADMFGLEMKAE